MITFKTTKKVLANSRLGIEEFITMKILEVKYIPNVHYTSKIQYSYGDVIERPVIISFTQDEVVAIENAVGGLEGDNFNERFVDLIKKASFATFDNDNTFGLTSADWEIVPEPEQWQE